MERKLATVLFADLVGSTAMGEQDPERTRALLERFYDAMAAEVERAGGTLEKFVGDAVMAAFGVPSAQEDHAERALHAALSMHRALGELFGDRLALRIGVNTGEVVVGGARAGSSFVTGDAVNVAKRLEEAAAPGEILAGERTAAAVRGAFELGEPQTLDAKGKTEPVTGRAVLRALSLMRPRGVGGLARAFVGRETELELLRATYRRTVDSCEPHLVTVMGDAGVGKTRLARELWQWLAGQETQPLQRTGRSLPYGRLTYWALAEILKEHLGILDSDSPDVVRRQLGARQELGPTLGLETPADVHPLAAQEQLHGAWVEFLSELAARRPAVVLVEELHWAEEPLLDLLERALREVHGPLLLIATSRPELLERRPAWGGGRRNASLVWLEPLAAAETERLVDELLAAELPGELRATLVERAEGNPFVVEELLGSLIDRGVLRRSAERWEVAEGTADVSVPDSVQSLLAARIDLLPAREKAALQAASVIGRVFWETPVRALLGGEEPDWRLLEDRDFVRRRAGSSMAGEIERVIKHAFTREVAYASLTKAGRARLHAALAGWLEQEGGREDQAGFLAHHYAEAVRPEDADLAWGGDEVEHERLRGLALAWLRRAAAQALARYDIAEGLAKLQRALELARDDAERLELWQEIARGHALGFEGEAFWTAMERALELAPDDATRGELYAHLSFQTAGRSGMWKRRPEAELVDGWIERAIELTEPDTADRARALVAKGLWNPIEGAQAAREASALAERLGDPELRSYAWDARGIGAFVAGEYELGRAFAERRFELLDQISDPDQIADIHATPISGCIWSGRFREARRLARAHDEIVERLTPHHRMHGVAILCEVEELAGGWELVRALTPRVLTAVEENAATPCVRNPRTLLVAAAAAAYAGEDAEARRLEAAAEEIGMEGYAGVLDAPRLRLALARGDLDRVEELFDIRPARRGWYRGWIGFAGSHTRLEALVALGRRDLVEDEAPTLERMGPLFQAFARRALGQVRGDEALVREALARFERMGLDWHSEQTRLVLQA